MKVLVTLAVEAEFAPWRRLRNFHRGLYMGVPIYDAEVDAIQLRVLLTGMGWEHARQAMQIALADPPDVCISSGLAGGLKPVYEVGLILAARTVIEAKMGRSFRSDDALLKLADDHEATIVESFRTSRWLVMSANDKRRMGEFTDAVEMESFSVMAASCGRGIPSIAIRAVSDTVETDLPYDFSLALDARGQVSLPRALAQIAARPQRLPALVRLVRQSRRAAAALAEFLDGYVRALPLWTSRPEAAWEEVAAT